jgi:hypothetical protein
VPSRKARLTDLLAGVTLVDHAQWEHLRATLAPISDSYLRHLLRDSGVPLTAEVEGIRQENFAELERTLLAATARAPVLEAKRHAELARRSPNVDRAVKTEMIEWMRVWLETPDAFPVWVKLRKATPEWRDLTEVRSPAP